MTLRIKLPRAFTAGLSITAMAIGLLPAIATANPILITDLLKSLRKGEPWDRGVFAATKMVMFQQAASGGTDAASISKITLSYFTSTVCTATNDTSVPTYTTPDGTSFTINTTTPFGMVAASAWNVGSSKVSPTVADMTTIQSIAVTLRSTDNNTPQACFGADCGTVNSNRFSFSCVPVTCANGECISSSDTQSFILKTTAAIGDPADGGVIACMNGGLNNLVTPTADNSTGIGWGGSGTTTSATNITNGATNTATIVRELGSGSSYAARTCSTYSAAGGFTSGWFLPAGNNLTSTGQLNCLFTNRATIGGFVNTGYWSSTEVTPTNAWDQGFAGAGQFSISKASNRRVRCSRAFTP